MAMKKKVPSDQHWKTKEMLEVEEATGHRMTYKQKTFADRFTEGNCTATHAAIEAGFSAKSASSIAAQLLNPHIYPQVVEYIAKIRDQKAAQYGVTKEGMLERLYFLSRGAEEAGQYSAAINAEKIRASLAGLTIDRRETVSSIDNMTKDQVISRLEELKRRHPAAFQVVDGEYSEPEPIDESMMIDVTPKE